MFKRGKTNRSEPEICRILKLMDLIIAFWLGVFALTSKGAELRIYTQLCIVQGFYTDTWNRFTEVQAVNFFRRFFQQQHLGFGLSNLSHGARRHADPKVNWPLLNKDDGHKGIPVDVIAWLCRYVKGPNQLGE